MKYSKPQLNEWRYGLPLATGSYCWWPASMPLGLAGLAHMRGRARALAFAMIVSCVPYIVYDEYLDLGQRGIDWGYGTRYLMVLMVPMMLGAAALWLPPFYAFKIVPGDLGTKGGMVTDASARALTTGGSVIPGLYAAGNSSAAVMGHSYAGAGSTIGPAMTFGYVAANYIADNPVT